MHLLQKTLNEQKLLHARYQQEMFNREEELNKLEQVKVSEMNELLITK